MPIKAMLMYPDLPSCQGAPRALELRRSPTKKEIIQSSVIGIEHTSEVLKCSRKGICDIEL